MLLPAKQVPLRTIPARLESGTLMGGTLGRRRNLPMGAYSGSNLAGLIHLKAHILSGLLRLLITLQCPNWDQYGQTNKGYPYIGPYNSTQLQIYKANVTAPSLQSTSNV